jgi:hypothetical protein
MVNASTEEVPAVGQHQTATFRDEAEETEIERRHPAAEKGVSDSSDKADKFDARFLRPLRE